MALRHLAVASAILALAGAGCGRGVTDSRADTPLSSSAPADLATTAPVGSYPESPGDVDTIELPDPTGCTSNPRPVFTHAYTDLDQIDFINPTIVTSGNWLKNRQYHKVITDADNKAPLVAVYAPVDSTATGITHYLGMMQLWDGTTMELPQFDIRFEATCEVGFWFDHISELAEPFASLADPDPALDTRDAETPISVAVRAGDLIGHTSGTEPAHTWDFIVVNSSIMNHYANQARYEQVSELVSLLHADCPFDYFEEPLRSLFRARIGSWQGSSAGFDCNLEPDVPGTIAGGWFLTPFDPAADLHRADWGLVAKLAADGSIDVNGPGTTVRTLPDAPTFKDPTTVTTEHCFEDFNQPPRHVYVELISDSQLAAAFGQGPCPTSLPADHQIFHR